jgi:hypothetical protein
MKTDSRPVIVKHQILKEKAMKKIVSGLAVLAVAGMASAQVNVPSGLTGLWQFASSTTELNGTIGPNLLALNEGTWFFGPYTQVGTVAVPDLYWDQGVVQTFTGGYVHVPDGIAPNGGGSYVNNYTIMMDYQQTTETPAGDPYNSLFQTASTPTANDGDLWIQNYSDGTTSSRVGSIIGSGDLGYSSLTFDASQWHRIVWSVDNSSFFRVYIDGTLYLDSAGQGIDGRYSLNPDFYLLADDTSEVAWGLLNTVAVWDHALSGSEVNAMGGWIGGAQTPTALIMVPEPATMSFMAFGVLAMVLLRRNRK